MILKMLNIKSGSQESQVYTDTIYVHFIYFLNILMYF